MSLKWALCMEWNEAVLNTTVMSVDWRDRHFVTCSPLRLFNIVLSLFEHVL
jgi:hypothetical protein